MVPTWVTETRTVMTTECRPETRERTVTVYKQVPETKTVERTHTVMVPETRTKQVSYTVRVPETREVTEEYTVCVPKYEDVTREYQVRVPVQREEPREYTVMVPHQETREGTRRVVKCVPVTETRTVCRDEGHWEEVASGAACARLRQRCLRRRCSDGCASCGDCEPCRLRRWCSIPCAQRLWSSGSLQGPKKHLWPRRCRLWRETGLGAQYRAGRSSSYRHETRVCRRTLQLHGHGLQTPEIRTMTVKLCSYQTETRTKTEKVCRYERETRTRTRQVTECKLETRTRDVNYTVCVPQQKTTTHEVTVYKMRSGRKGSAVHRDGPTAGGEGSPGSGLQDGAPDNSGARRGGWLL